jgi:hypothetical protein
MIESPKHRETAPIRKPDVDPIHNERTAVTDVSDELPGDKTTVNR